MTLDDSLWKTLGGGYKTPYDVSIPLRQLESTSDGREVDRIFEELWDELHHQGDVGLASYLAVPQLVRIAKEKGLFDWNILALCSIIEQQRYLGKNPSIPDAYRSYYEGGLRDLKQFVISNLSSEMDENTLRTALSALATCGGQIKLGKAIMQLEDDDMLDGFLEEYS